MRRRPNRVMQRQSEPDPEVEPVLVTGAAGFIGRNVVSSLLERGTAVRVLVRDARRTESLGSSEVVVGDLTQPDTLAGIERGVQTVIHCAARLGKWGTGEEELYEVNVRGSINLLERFRDAKLHRFVHVSAGGVTGPLAGKDADETYECRPATPYERTKLEGERQVLQRAGETGIPVVVVRPTFTYGPGDPHKLALFRAIKRGRFAFIGNGESVNHPVYVDDVVAGILLAAARGEAGQVYIIGGPRPVTKRELVRVMAEALGVAPPRLRVPRRLGWWAAIAMELLGRTAGFEPILTRSRVMMMGDDFGYSIEKAKRELGYAPETGLEAGIAATVRAYEDSGSL